MLNSTSVKLSLCGVFLDINKSTDGKYLNKIDINSYFCSLSGVILNKMVSPLTTKKYKPKWDTKLIAV